MMTRANSLHAREAGSLISLPVTHDHHPRKHPRTGATVMTAVVGYGGKIEIPTMEMVATEKTIVGNLVGTYPDLVELMALADRGKVTLATKEYRLSDANSALHDLVAGKVKGRAVLIP